LGGEADGEYKFQILLFKDLGADFGVKFLSADPKCARFTPPLEVDGDDRWRRAMSRNRAAKAGPGSSGDAEAAVPFFIFWVALFAPNSTFTFGRACEAQACLLLVCLIGRVQ